MPPRKTLAGLEQIARDPDAGALRRMKASHALARHYSRKRGGALESYYQGLALGYCFQGVGEFGSLADAQLQGPQRKRLQWYGTTLYQSVARLRDLLLELDPPDFVFFDSRSH